MWQKHKFHENTIYSAKIGKFNLLLQKQDKVWNIASNTMDDVASEFTISELSELPEDHTWNKHIADNHLTVYIMPALPDRPIVLKPEKGITIMPGMNLNFYIYVPLWLQLYASTVKEDNLMLDLPVEELSSTWFGAPDNGELAYSYPGDILFRYENGGHSQYTALCPVKIKNESENVLQFERLAIHVNQLNTYQKSNYLYTNELRVRFRGEEQTSDVQIVSGSPPEAQGSTLLSNARLKTNKGLLQKSFFFIKSFTQY